MSRALKPLPDNVAALQAQLLEQQTRNEQLSTENQRYRSQIVTLQEQLNLALAHRGLTLVQQLYRIEKQSWTLTADERHARRQKHARPILDEMRTWLETHYRRRHPQQLLARPCTACAKNGTS